MVVISTNFSNVCDYSETFVLGPCGIEDSRCEGGSLKTGNSHSLSRQHLCKNQPPPSC